MADLSPFELINLVDCLSTLTTPQRLELIYGLGSLKGLDCYLADCHMRRHVLAMSEQVAIFEQAQLIRARLAARRTPVL